MGVFHSKNIFEISTYQKIKLCICGTQSPIHMNCESNIICPGKNNHIKKGNCTHGELWMFFLTRKMFFLTRKN